MKNIIYYQVAIALTVLLSVPLTAFAVDEVTETRTYEKRVYRQSGSPDTGIDIEQRRSEDAGFQRLDRDGDPRYGEMSAVQENEAINPDSKAQQLSSAGTIVGVDAREIIIRQDPNNEDLRFIINSQTRLNDLDSISELNENDAVYIYYKDVGGQKVATAISRANLLEETTEQRRLRQI